MPIKIRFKLFKACLITLIISSCVNYDRVEIKEVEDIKLVSFSDKWVVVDSKVKLSNPNFFDINIIDSKLDVIVQGHTIGTAKVEEEFILPSQSEEFYTLRLKSQFNDLKDNDLVNLFALMMDNDKQVDFKFEGYIIGKVFFIKRKVVISHEDKVRLELF